MISEVVRSPLGPPTVVPIRNPSFLPNWKRRRLKLILRRRSTLSVSVSLKGLFHGIASVFPVVIAPALGFLSVATRRRREDDLEEDVAGSWIMFSSPTAFNRSVLLRCPSILFEESGRTLDGVNERLVEEERHFVHFDSRRIPVSGEKDGWCDNSVVEYQRVCVRTDDGGVIALDWPDNLDLEKEHGLDATVLLVPGTTEGSLDRDVRSFLCQALRYGCFPVVMNPRGCAGSPVITPRLFTAADSDDIATAVRFIKRSRPWTTLMCVGWGYGSNMLTKYLSESGEKTSVTAAICLDNPFDLDEATSSYPHCDALDQKLAHGLVDVLQANKEIFQGKNKGFDVARALSATMVRDFEEAISMISYGFEDIREFYSKCSTRNSVRSVRIPLLFIQSDERIAPILSIPHNSIMENPFSSLLMCSCLPSNVIRSGRSSTVWCQHLAFEWLQAVELALLSGRHPFPEGVNIPLNLSSNFPLLDTSESEKILSSSSKIKGKYLSTSQNSQTEKHIVKLPQSNDVSCMFEKRNNTEQEIASGCEIVTNNEHEKGVYQFVERTKALPLEKEKEEDNSWAMVGVNQNRNVDRNEGGNEKILKIDSHDGGTMVGSLTSVMCSSSLLSYHQKDNIQESYERIISTSNNNDTDNLNMQEKVERGIQDTDHGNLMSTITEKAMSVVASPIVPIHNDGKLDQERLVTILMELGQKGGLFRVFCNIALLWGGIRSATSLTDRLIGFLCIAERPLFQRILGFACMLLVIWSPIAIPLLPNIVQSWEAKISYGISGYACLAGLHVAILILIILWGKRIRGYDYPLKQYGLSYPSISKVHDFLRGLIGGTMLALAVHFVNASLGYACFVRPPNLPRFSAGATVLVKEYGRLALLFIRGTLIASCVAVMEELLFRSWLLDEIYVDHGYNLAIIISGLAFSLFQRSLSSIPGFLFLSLALFGIKQRDHGSLYIPIGVRSGIMLTSFLIQVLGFITYKSSTPFWLASTHFRHPFDGAVGLSFCIMLAIFLYPREHLDREKV